MKILGCNHQHHSYISTSHPTLSPLQCSHCCPFLSLGIKPNRWRAGFRDPNTVFFTDGLHTRYRRITVSPKVVDVELGPICGEEDSIEQILPPWGNLAVEQRSDSQNVCSSVHLVTSEGKASQNESRLQFLEEQDEEILSKRILKLSRSNKIRSAMELYRSMEFSGLRPNSHACNSLLSCLLRAKRIDEALTIFEFIKVNQMTTGHSYSLILKGIADARGGDSALDIFEEIVENSDLKKDLDAIAYNTMITVIAKENNWFQIERIWRSMKDNGLIGTTVTYRLLICSFVRCGQNELALDAYHEMVQNGLKPADDAMQAIIGAYVKEGRWVLALNVFHDMLNSGMKPTAVTCNTLINSLGKVGKVNLAFKVYGLMESLGHVPDAYTWNALIGALCRGNRHADALQLFKSIQLEKSAELNIHVYNSALMSCQKLGLWDRALQVLWQMEASGLSISTASYNLVIGACEVARKPKAALQVYKHMVHKKRTPDMFTRLSLLRCCIWGSLWNEVDKILNDSPNGSFYNAAIQGLCLRGRIDSARKHYEKMRKISLKPDGKTRALMLQNFQRGRDVKRSRSGNRKFGQFKPKNVRVRFAISVDHLKRTV